MRNNICLLLFIFLGSYYSYSQETNFAKKFSNAENDSLFLLNYPNTKIEKFAIAGDREFSFMDSIIFPLKLKTVLGPYKEGNQTIYVKVVQIDSAYKVHVGNIWLSNLKMDSVERMKIAYEILNQPKLFDKYCHKYSYDNNKSFDCELQPVFSYVFVEPFSSETSTRKKGEIYIVETKFGTHIVKSLSDPYYDRSIVEYIILYIN